MRGKLQRGTYIIESSLTETPNLWVRSCLRGSINLFISVQSFRSHQWLVFLHLRGRRCQKVQSLVEDVAYGFSVSEPVNAEDPFAVVNSSHVIGWIASIREPRES